ncbi:hypothetical protein [Clostridium sp. UBA6640]|uniref:DUF7922 domain-containing protein n=1 Tax=Clostridium sp. UBA6640 TaxID=1946370 RepID=UPI0025C70D6B|nr:hypothetical protein [Clostridium sp. UBA6640]
MTPKKSYSRFFIILQEDEKGYSLEQDKAPSGYAKLEMKNNKCKLSYYVQNVNKQKGPCHMILICDKKDTKKIIKIAKMNIDDYGRADVTYEYDMNNIANSGISADRIAGAAIVKLDGSKIGCIMHGFITSDVSKDWKDYEVVSEEDMKPMPREVIFDEYEQRIEAVKENNLEESNTVKNDIEEINIAKNDVAKTDAVESDIEENIVTAKNDMENSELDEEMRKKKHKSDCSCKEKEDKKKEEKKECKKEEKKEEKMNECKDHEHDKHDHKEKKEHCDDHKMKKDYEHMKEDHHHEIKKDCEHMKEDHHHEMKKDCEHMKEDHHHEMKKDCEHMKEDHHHEMKKDCEHIKEHHDHEMKKDCDYMEKEYEYMKEDCSHMKKDYDHMNKPHDYKMKKDCEYMEKEYEYMKEDCSHMKEDYDHMNKYYDHMKKGCDHMKKEYGHEMKKDYEHMNKECDHEMKMHCDHMKKEYNHPMKHECHPHHEEHEKMYEEKDTKSMMAKFFKGIVKEFEKMDGYNDIKNCQWYKVPVEKMEEMYCMHDYKKYTVIYYPMICYYPYIAKHKHFMIGHKYDINGNLKYIVYALPGRKSESDQPYGGKTGFVAWMPHRHDAEMGYWLMFYDFKNSTVVVPVRR